jgi:multicomponent Na+:H+ antiporter subunit C
METGLILAVGGLVTAAVYMFLARDLPRVLIGFVLFGTAANLAILASGRVGGLVPPLVAPGASALATDASNPLPQALILTAIVIGFGLAAFALMLMVKAHAAFGTVLSDEMSAAEGADDDRPAAASAPVRPEREAA